jgi:hypothetical protein
VFIESFMDRFKTIFLTLAVLGLMAPVFASAVLDPDDPYGIKGASANTQLIQTTQTIPEIIGSIIGIALSFVGIVFFLLILYAGFRWMTAFGNEEKVTNSKDIMEHALIGLVIILAAYAISNFVFSNLPGGGGQATPTAQSSAMGCCSNTGTGNTVQTLKANCSGATRSWQAGPCLLGCCRNSTTRNCASDITNAKCIYSSEQAHIEGVWQPGACKPADCDVINGSGSEPVPEPEPPAPPAPLVSCCTNNNDTPPLSLEGVPQAQCGGFNEVWNPVPCNQQPGCCTVAFNPNNVFTRNSTAPNCRGGGETWKAGPCP